MRIYLGSHTGLYLPKSYGGAGVVDAFASVARDSASGRYFPANAAQWDTVLTWAGTSGGPSNLWLCQEASGNLADSLGTGTMLVSGTPAFRQAVPGYSRLGITFTDNAAQSFVWNTGPDVLTTSALLLAFYHMPSASPAAARGLMGLGSSTARTVAVINATPQWEARHGLNTVADTVSPYDGAVHPCVLRTNRTAQEADFCTDLVKLSPTFDVTISGRPVVLGAAVFNPCAATLLYACLFTGASAEKTDAQIKAIMQTLRWPVIWS